MAFVSNKVAIIQTKSAIIAFFSPSLFLLALSFSPFLFNSFDSLLWFWSFSGEGNLPFDAFTLKWPQISLGWFSKKSTRCFQRILPVFQSVPFRSGGRRFRPFGINATHLVGSMSLNHDVWAEMRQDWVRRRPLWLEVAPLSKKTWFLVNI